MSRRGARYIFSYHVPGTSEVPGTFILDTFWQVMTACRIRIVSMRKLKALALFVFGLSILFYFFFDFCKHTPSLGAANPFASDPYDAVGSFGIQLALLSALLTLIRTFRPFPQKEAAPGQILLTLRTGTVVLLSVTVTLAADAIGLARSIGAGGASPVAWALVALVTGMVLVTLAAGWIFVRAARRAEVPSARPTRGRAVIISGLAILILAFFPLAWRNSGVPGAIFSALAGMALLFLTVWAVATAIFPAAESNYEDIFADSSAIFQAVFQRFGRAAGYLTWMGKLAAFPPLRRLLGWLNPRRHRWNLVILAGVAMGLLLVLVEAVAEGMSPNLGRALLVVGVYVSLESAGVVLGYLLFGKYLGIYRAE